MRRSVAAQTLVRLRLTAKADVNAAENDGKTALMSASANGHLEVVQALLAARADVNARQGDGSTALTLVLQNDHPEVAKTPDKCDRRLSPGKVAGPDITQIKPG